LRKEREGEGGHKIDDEKGGKNVRKELWKIREGEGKWRRIEGEGGVKWMGREGEGGVF
jgi:hypothetical protein